MVNYWDPTPPLAQRPRFVIGLDLGKNVDYSALAIIKTIETISGIAPPTDYECVYLKRWPLQTSYPTIVEDVTRFCTYPPFGDYLPDLVIDKTGVGNAVFDLFDPSKINAGLYGVVITGGVEVVRENNIFKIPKRELVSVVQANLQSSRLKISDKLPEGDLLAKEFAAFQVSISETTGHDTYEGRRSNDDLVLALSLALWLSKNTEDGLRPLDPAIAEAIANYRGRG